MNKALALNATPQQGEGAPVSRDDVLQELCTIAFAALPGEEPADTQMDMFTAAPPPAKPRNRVTVKPAEKLKALELVGKHLGLFDPAARDPVVQIITHIPRPETKEDTHA